MNSGKHQSSKLNTEAKIYRSEGPRPRTSFVFQSYTRPFFFFIRILFFRPRLGILIFCLSKAESIPNNILKFQFDIICTRVRYFIR